MIKNRLEWHHGRRICRSRKYKSTKGSDGNPAVIQTASWYLDSVLRVCSVWPEQLQQIAAACFWIAQKIHGPVASASMLIKCANGAFSKTQLLRAEEAILMKLKFPSQPVVPQDYITYLSWWLDDAHPDEIEIAAVFLCLCDLMVNKTLCNELPSVIAAACVQALRLTAAGETGLDAAS
ncbi:unnamed protein product [Parnassius apollo]|uniref:(apollo) hypothetical protein n=1 Tax=Parnassius apollo TaxID=110799 RepID=A0A8S3WIR7_PARAO|nr:unnamed protein product [Parnassius apollo]